MSVIGWLKGKKRNKVPMKPTITYNCARVYVGSYVGGGTNQHEKVFHCNYRVLSGEVSVKKLRPLRVKGTNTEGTIFKLDTLVLYPESDTALVAITNGKRQFEINLTKPHNSQSSIFKLRL